MENYGEKDYLDKWPSKWAAQDNPPWCRKKILLEPLIKNKNSLWLFLSHPFKFSISTIMYTSIVVKACDLYINIYIGDICPGCDQNASMPLIETTITISK